MRMARLERKPIMDIEDLIDPCKNPLVSHLFGTLVLISRMTETDPRAALLAKTAIESRRIESIAKKDPDTSPTVSGEDVGQSLKKHSDYLDEMLDPSHLVTVEIEMPKTQTPDEPDEEKRKAERRTMPFLMSKKGARK
jgi:hypothetical protein